MSDDIIPDAALDAMEARARAASLHPWRRTSDPEWIHIVDSPDAPRGYSDCTAIDCGFPEVAEFLFNARDDMPRLVAELRRLRALARSLYVEAERNAMQPDMGSHGYRCRPETWDAFRRAAGVVSREERRAELRDAAGGGA